MDDVSELDEDVPEEEDATDDDIAIPTSARRSCAAAVQARKSIQSAYDDRRTPLVLKFPAAGPTPRELEALRASTNTFKAIDPVMMQMAESFASRKVALLPPPTISGNRLKVDKDSLHLYAADGCTTTREMWETALSSSRFKGPRRHPPFRELYRLTDPGTYDGSEWAENIR